MHINCTGRTTKTHSELIYIFVKHERKKKMYNLTDKAQDFFLSIGNLFVREPHDIDPGLKSFCKSEYGKDWYWAYNSYKTDGKFPTLYKTRK